MEYSRASNYWALYSTDLEAARQYIYSEIRKQLEGNYFVVDIWHKAISLGMGNYVKEVLDKHISKKDSLYYSLQFRIERLNGNHNEAYKLLYPDVSKKQFRSIIQDNLNKDYLEIALNGGLGDHLEAISILIPISQKLDCKLKLSISEKYQSILKSTLEENNIKIGNGLGLNYTFLRAWMNWDLKNIQHINWIKSNNSAESKKSFLFCWQAYGKADIFSSHCRSIKFNDVVYFYKLLKRDNELEDIIDISQWKMWEANILKKMGIKLYNTALGDLSDLSRLINDRNIITVDTALAHQCASLGKKAIVLLPKFPDERWIGLNQNKNSYGKYLIFKKQTNFNQWKKELLELYNDNKELWGL